MVQDPISQICTTYVAVYYCDNNGTCRWYGYSGWFKKHIMRREFSLFKAPRGITREDAKMLKQALTLYDLGRITIWELRMMGS